jgi:hypothetical protein
MFRSLYTYLQRKIIDILIRIAERDLYNTPVKPLDEKKQLNFYASLFFLPGFQAYSVDRETRFVHSLAREWSDPVKGQRAENSLLWLKAKRAADKQQETLGKGGTSTSAPSPKR